MGTKDGFDEYASSTNDDETERLVKYAEEWYRSITTEEAKRRMIENYLNGVTNEDFPQEKIEEAADKVLERDDTL